MARSSVDICNMALGRIGISKFIASLEEASTEARVCRKFYEETRDRVLEEFPWNFATSFVDLQDLGTPPTGWAYRFRYPGNCLTARKLVLSSDIAALPSGSSLTSMEQFLLTLPDYPYQVVEDEANGGLAICCNLDAPVLIFTRRITNTALFSGPFVNALAWALAAELATPLSALPNFAIQANQAYLQTLNGAITRNLNEQVEASTESEFITVRG